MRASSVTDDSISAALEACNGNASKAAALVGLSPSRMRERRVALGSDSVDSKLFSVGELSFRPQADDKLSIDQLIQRRLAEFERVQQAELLNAATDVEVGSDAPLAIVVFGDPHLDDPGTDLRALIEHTNIINATDGMYGACIGDIQNNWVGRLAHLYSQQETTAQQSWQLTEWWINYCEKWLFMVDGNHDAWSGNDNPLPWIRALSGRPMIQNDHEAIINLNFPNGFQYIIAARHNWPGQSGWNPAHGEFKAALTRLKAHLIVSGHTHTSLDAALKVETHDVVTRCVKVGSYKIYDRYAKELGFAKRQIAPSFAVVIDPASTTDTGKAQLFYDIDKAAGYLTFLRKEYHDGLQPPIYKSKEFHAQREGRGRALN